MLNKVMLMGRLTGDPEVRYSPSGVAVARFSLAVQRSYVKQGEERQTDFINIVAFRSTAEFVGKYFGKGQLMVVVGSLQTRSWDDKDGNKRYGMDVVADEIHFAESKKDRDSSSAYQAPAPQAKAPASGQVPPAPVVSPADSFDDNFMPAIDDDVDLPF